MDILGNQASLCLLNNRWYALRAVRISISTSGESLRGSLALSPLWMFSGFGDLEVLS
jgi:hypothetical protein